jgi:riboflavin kinase/FMN adenylyltransferase
MAIHRQSLNGPLPEAFRQGAITIGNFDGVHLGHQALLVETVRQARLLSGPAVAVTFDPHPQQLLRPEAFQPPLTTAAYRSELLEGHGAEHVVVLEITPEFLKLSARDFFERLIRQGLAARAIVEGFNFAFGRAREGTIGVLRSLAQDAGIAVNVLEAHNLGGKAVSTSRVRAELAVGNVAAACQLLGRAYRLVGTVGAGQRRGRTLGFPTANLQNVPTFIPRDAVYAVRARMRRKWWPAAANIGPNPTFGEQARKVEVHVIGFEGDLYNEVLSVDFVERLRDTRTFSGPAELADQLRQDVAEAQNILAAQSVSLSDDLS